MLGVLGTGIAYILNYRLLADDGSTVASTVTYLIPVVVVLFGVAVLGEPLSPRVLVGMVVVLAGVGLARRGAASPPAPVAGTAESGGAGVPDSSARPCGIDRPPN